MIDEKPILHLIDHRLKILKVAPKEAMDKSALPEEVKDFVVDMVDRFTTILLTEVKEAMLQQTWEMKTKGDECDDASAANDSFEIYDKYFSKRNFTMALTMVNLLYVIVFEQFIKSGLKGSLDRKHIKHLMQLPQKDILKMLSGKKR